MQRTVANVMQVFSDKSFTREFDMHKILPEVMLDTSSLSVVHAICEIMAAASREAALIIFLEANEAAGESVTARRSPLAAHSPLNAQRSTLNAQRSPLTVHCLPLTAHRSLLTAHDCGCSLTGRGVQGGKASFL